MQTNPRSGGGIFTCFIAILLIASLALNAAFVTGCVSSSDFGGGNKIHSGDNGKGDQVPAHPVEDVYLREIAVTLGFTPQPGQMPGDIARVIQQKLDNSEEYHGDVFTVDSFRECKAAISTTKDKATFEAYHAFIKKIEGKKVVILNQ